MALTVYGTVTLLEAVVPPNPPEEPGPPEGPPDPLQGEFRTIPAKRELKEGEEEAKTWTHLHVTLDAPNSGEVSVLCPEMEASGLVLDGRARVSFSSQ